jgi:hypothetical protein
MPKDNVLTLKLPGDNLVFTRYLYIKDEVKTALLISILNKSDDAIFWAYELYYSGFKNELYAFIWQIYYDFFATLNPSFFIYLSKKLGQEDLIQRFGPKEHLIEDRLISSIIQNLLIRSFNTDVFILRTISELFESEAGEEAEIEDLLETKDYRGLALYILNNKDLELEDTYQRVLNHFKLTNQQKQITDFRNAIKSNAAKKEIILVANIFALINKNLNQIKKQNFYVRVDPEEVVQYETIEAADNLRPYRILAQACICKIQNNWVNLFQGFRNQKIEPGLKKKYDGWTFGAVTEKYNSLNKWIYHASFSPMWFDRIKSCKGYVDYVNQEVKFVSEEWEEEFHNKYGYEPDEQPLFVKENVLKQIKDDNASLWQHFFAKYKKNGMIDALEEEIDALNEEPLKYA